MSIADQITRIKNNIAASYAECSAKGATLPTDENSENLPNTIASISTGSEINNQDKTITANGTYTADAGYTGLGTVTVNVPTPSGGGVEITAYNYSNTKYNKGDWVNINTTATELQYSGNQFQGYTSTVGWLNAFYIDNPEKIFVMERRGLYSGNGYLQDTTNEPTQIIAFDKPGGFTISEDGYVCGEINIIYNSNTETAVIVSETQEDNTADYKVDFLSCGGRLGSGYYNGKTSLYLIDRDTGNISKTYNYVEATGYGLYGIYSGVKIGNDYIVQTGITSTTNTPKIELVNFNEDASTYSLTTILDDGNARAFFGYEPESGIIFMQKAGSVTNQSNLLAYTWDSTNKQLNAYSVENFPEAMRDCFSNSCYNFWNGKTKIFTSYIKSLDKLVCCQYLNGKWIDKSPIRQSYVGNTYTAFTVSADFSRFSTSEYGSMYCHIYQGYGNNLAAGNYIVPHRYTNDTTSFMGKAKTDISANIGTECTVVIPAIANVKDPILNKPLILFGDGSSTGGNSSGGNTGGSTGGSTGDNTGSTTIDPSTLKFGDRIDNKATVVSTFESSDLGTVVFAVLDSKYFSYKNWATGLYGTDTDLPNWPQKEGALQPKESATYNTDYILTNYSDKEIEAFTYCRSIEPLEFNGKTYNCQIPNAYELQEIGDYRSKLYKLDPTASSNTSYRISDWKFGRSNNAWSSTECTSTTARKGALSNGEIVMASGNKDYISGVIPIIEIPLKEV